jgi:hypothetical protein
VAGLAAADEPTADEIYQAQRAEDRMSQYDAFAEEIELMKRADAGEAEAQRQLDQMAAGIQARMRGDAKPDEGNPRRCSRSREKSVYRCDCKRISCACAHPALFPYHATD